MQSRPNKKPACAVEESETSVAERIRFEIDSCSPPSENWLPICRSEKSLELLRKAGRYTKATAPVMIVGECGTGRRQVAKYIHAHSTSKSFRVVRVACGLAFESKSSVDGRATFSPPLSDDVFSDASILWLFENVDQIPLAEQPSLVTLLEKISVTNADRSHPGVISTAGIGVFDALECGQLREELFYKLYVLGIDVPPLRHRKEEISGLVEYFSSRCSRPDTQPHRFTPDANSLLSEYHWPGNILELRNVIAQQCALSDRVIIDSEQLSQNWQLRKRVPQIDQATLNLEEAETRIILDALMRCQGNKTATAKKLGITTRTLHNKINKFRRMGLVA